jgi:hypothetical protein
MQQKSTAAHISLLLAIPFWFNGPLWPFKIMNLVVKRAEITTFL